MILEDKYRIAATARQLIHLLENCHDSDFVNMIVECVATTNSFLLEVERL